jgi:hypothetical protein
MQNRILAYLVTTPSRETLIYSTPSARFDFLLAKLHHPFLRTLNDANQLHRPGIRHPQKTHTARHFS